MPALVHHHHPHHDSKCRDLEEIANSIVVQNHRHQSELVLVLGPLRKSVKDCGRESAKILDSMARRHGNGNPRKVASLFCINGGNLTRTCQHFPEHVGSVTTQRYPGLDKKLLTRDCFKIFPLAPQLIQAHVEICETKL